MGGAVALACLVVLVAALTPNLIFFDDDVLDFVVRKLGHLVAYFGIAFGASVAIGANLPLRHTAGLVLTGAIALAVLDEVVQLDVAGRLSSPFDVILDAVGAVGGIAAWIRFERWQEARS